MESQSNYTSDKWGGGNKIQSIVTGGSTELSTMESGAKSCRDQATTVVDPSIPDY